ncbi:MAG: hypothetical protein ICV78_08675 [Tolypothrix sp. Co-bin9]|nr:hypothetical protein [Tolypothrix sp. Co-bin9]
MSLVIAFFPIGGAIALLGATNPVTWVIIGGAGVIYAASEVNKAMKENKESKNKDS